MGLIGNFPIALAPGMGMNAYFTYSVVGWRGSGKVSYQAAVTAVLIEGAIFFVLALSGLRYKIIKLVPGEKQRPLNVLATFRFVF